MLKELKPAFLMMIVMTAITGLAYPALITGLAQGLFPEQADGSLVSVNGQVVGSRLIGQRFTRPEYFHGRPSSAGAGGYDAAASAGSNLGPTSAKLFNGTTKTDNDTNAEVVDFDGLKLRVVHYCLDNGIGFESSQPLEAFMDAKGQLDDVKLVKAFNDTAAPFVFTPKTSIPADAVTGSASGLDPDISPANADLQTARVAKARGVPVERVKAIVARHTVGRTLGILGEPHVNVLALNLALDEQLRAK
jgi:K+-transporting ATPase ATPase C chain